MQLVAAIEHVRRSTVQIGVINPAAPPQAPAAKTVLGSGFIVSEQGHIVTAMHVVEEAQKRIGASGGAYELYAAWALPNTETGNFIMRSNFSLMSINEIDRDHSNDLALLQVEGGSLDGIALKAGPATAAAGPVRFGPSRPADGTLIAISGYPLGEPNLVTTSGGIASAWATDATPGSPDRYLADLTANPGNSGGPAYRIADAHVIGVCIAGKLTNIVGGAGMHQAGLTILVPNEYVLALMERNAVK